MNNTKGMSEAFLSMSNEIRALKAQLASSEERVRVLREAMEFALDGLPTNVRANQSIVCARLKAALTVVEEGV